VDPGQNNAFRAINRTWSSGGAVRFVGGARPRYLLTGLSADSQQSMVENLALQAERAGVAGVQIARPRIGLYRPWTANMDEGWTRWVLERYDFDFASLRDADVRAGSLGERYDVIVLPDPGRGSMATGHRPGTMPARYVGGIGASGVRALVEFVRQGGTLVCLNGSAAFAIEELGLEVENVVADLEREEFFAGISILDVETSTHPVMAGMPEHAAITSSRSPAWRLPEGSEASVLMRYPDSGNPLLSGYLLGEEHLRGNAAALSVPHGEGRVVMFGFRPQWRGQPFGTFRVLFNALLVGGLGIQGDAP